MSDQLRLVEPFLDRLDEKQRREAIASLRGEPLWVSPVHPGIKSGENENLERGALFLPDGQLLAWHGRSRNLVCLSALGVNVWELELGHYGNACALGLDGAVWAFQSTQSISRLVPAETWSQPPTIEPVALKSQGNRIVKVAAFAPTGNHLALGLGGRGNGPTGALVIDLGQEALTAQVLGKPPHSGNSMTEALTWSRDGQRLYVGGSGGGARNVVSFGYQVSEGPPRKVFEGLRGVGTTETAYDLELLGGELYHGLQDGYVRLVRGLEGAEEDQSVTFVDSGDSAAAGKTHKAEVVAVLATKQGDWIYTVGGGFLSSDAHDKRERNQVRVWSRDAKGKLELHTTIEYASAARRALLSEDGRRLVLVCVDGSIRLYDTWLLRQ